ncbi:MAG: Helix-turn-helix domain [Thermoleophilia bacterium]|nr:Helix-turn-helix domain [Thermoleophilia bacterium]
MDMTETIQEIAARIQTARIRSGMTIVELAEASGLNLARVNEIETGVVEPSLTEFVRMADALKVPAAELVPDR